MNSQPSVSNANNVRLLWLSITFLLSATWLYAANERFLLDPDTFWHIKTGKDIWQSQTLPIFDSYSHTFAGHPWIAKEWLSQIILYMAHRAGGWNLVVTLVMFCIALTGSLIFFFLSLRIHNLAAVAIATLALVLSMQTYLARPHVFTFPLLILWTGCLLHASERRDAPNFWLLPIIAIWSNLHGSFIIGLVIAGLCFLIFFEQARFTQPKELLRWAMFLLLSGLASLLHPYGFKPILISFATLDNAWLQLPFEWRAIDVRSDPIHELALFSLLCVVLATGLRLRFAKIIFVLVMLHLFLSHIRFAYLFYYLVPMAVSFEIAAQHRRFSSTAWNARPDDLGAAIVHHHALTLSAALLSIYLIFATTIVGFADLRPKDHIAPVKALNFAKAMGLAGNVLNSGEFGGFLVFEGVKTFIDGRNDQLFRGSFIQTVFQTLRADGGDAFSQQLHKYRIAWTLLIPTDTRIQKLDRDPNWERVYEDEVAIIHVLRPEARP